MFAFCRENRLPFVVRIRDLNQEPSGRIVFMKEPRVSRGDAPQNPICNLNINLPESIKSETSGMDQAALDELQNKFDQARGDGSGQEPAGELLICALEPITL